MVSTRALEKVECVVIGAGVVGLAIARSLAESGKEVILLDAADDIGTGISSRSSEVIHAGIYYPHASLKARLCLAGKALLYEYAAQRNIPHRQCGKFIVATDDAQMHKLTEIKGNAKKNGVDDLVFLSCKQAQNIEPALQCIGAIFSPSTGIIDSHAFMLSLQGDFENTGGICVFRSKIQNIFAYANNFHITVASKDEEYRLKSSIVINAAGLSAVEVSKNTIHFPTNKIPHMRMAKGNYFKLSGKAPFKHLIYPVPEDAGLGVHLTFDLAGQCRFGPDVEWVEDIDYRVNSERLIDFEQAIRKYWPDLPEDSISPDYAGIRPKIYFSDSIHTDFVIQTSQCHGIKGLVNLFGIESPGLTSALAIADYVTEVIASEAS